MESDKQVASSITIGLIFRQAYMRMCDFNKFLIYFFEFQDAKYFLALIKKTKNIDGLNFDQITGISKI